MSNFSGSVKSILSVIKTQLSKKQDAIMTKGVYSVGNSTYINNDLTVISASTVKSNSNRINLKPISDSLLASQSRVLSVVVISSISYDVTPVFQNGGALTTLCEDLIITAGKTIVFILIVYKDSSSTVFTIVNKVSQP